MCMQGIKVIVDRAAALFKVPVDVMSDIYLGFRAAR
jgi:hypothetical protein